MPLSSRSTRTTVITLFLLFLQSVLYGQTLVVDEFDGVGQIDQAIWRLPFLNDGAFYGRTEAKTDRSIHYPLQQGGSAILQLDTFRDDGNGGSTGLFHGAEIHTKRNFVVAGGLSFDVTARLVDPVGGLVGGAFLFDVQRNNAQGLLTRDEIDFELLSNFEDALLTNYWNDGTFFGPDSNGFPLGVMPASGFDITEFQNYRLEWYPDRMDWYVNDVLVRTTENNVPDDPMNFRLNLWAPDMGFGDAFNPSLQPAPNLATNETFEYEVDRVEIKQLNTLRSENLLLDPSFENPSFPFFSLNNSNPDQSATGRWIAFNNVNFSTAQANAGNRSLAMFGPFSGSGDASGIFQNVDVQPGDILEASVACRTNIGDSIAGEENFTVIKLEFLDSSGNVIPGIEPFLSANGKESIVLEGRDPGTPENQWILQQVCAIAPIGAAKARVQLLFVQLANGPGATFFDDLELVRLTPLPFQLGDVNQDGVINLLDVAPFVTIISDGGFQFEADINQDGIVNLLDVAPFVNLLTN